jgi:hypothetical protein
MADRYAVRYGRGPQKRYILSPWPEGAIAPDDAHPVFQDDSKSAVIAEAQRRNGYEPVDGSERTYGEQLRERGLR